MDEAAAADVHPHVADAVEEDEVAGAQRAARDADAEVEVGVARMRQVEPEVRVDEADEAGAVEPGAGRVSAPAVGDAEQPPGEVDGADAERLDRRDPAQMRAVREEPRRLPPGLRCTALGGAPSACPGPKTLQYARTNTSRRRRIRAVMAGVPCGRPAAQRMPGVVGCIH